MGRISIKMKASIGLVLLFVCVPLWADRPTVEIAIENHLFIPSEIEVPANTKIKLIIHNKDDTPEEFESYELNREKIVVGGQKVTVFIGPLSPGEYPFFGEFHPKTALGKFVVKE